MSLAENSTVENGSPAPSTGGRTFGLSESAAKRITRMLTMEEHGETKFMRVAVEGGGCSGFQYDFGFDDEVKEDDHTFVSHGVTVVVDDTSLDLLNGGELDYVEELLGAYFQVTNPNASSSCGCGTSFSI
ncbi:iron-sulfur cluster insertion protein ErpA [Nisaea acidiphila]|uniref:Iron-sulfur cluster insertion protein ErpA n=1 Tax=Nisaea acidiphila TaxID=1862145 RepID=A0A9J7AS49_9PROT|nr:iron-sulfur cluster insertion protein ErpA [Nisaea acidiphila]UUX50087.1 iron-sulfur cluster insertion protein ErpA [Nisaea acidiphila]